MVFTRLHRRWMAWVAALAILMGALAPTISHGMRAWSHSPVTWVEVCSSTGAKLIAVSSGLSNKPTALSGQGRGLPGSEHAGEHCPFCLAHASDVALLPAPTPVVPVIAPAAQALPRLFLHAPRTLFAWAPSQARAPPASV
jgi:hypothetical protein